MRKKNSIINMIVGLVGQLLNMLLSFGGRMVFVHYLSQEYLGVNGLFGDVLGMLNLAELGIGSAMIFSMYRPAAQNDEKQLARLMNLYRTLYRIVAVAVLGIGLALVIRAAMPIFRLSRHTCCPTRTPSIRRTRRHISARRLTKSSASCA